MSRAVYADPSCGCCPHPSLWPGLVATPAQPRDVGPATLCCVVSSALGMFGAVPCASVPPRVPSCSRVFCPVPPGGCGLPGPVSASRPQRPTTPWCLPRRYMKHKRDDGPEKQEDEAVDVTPVMTCVFVVMCCSMLVLLYYFYDLLGARPRAGGPRRGDAARPVRREGGVRTCPPASRPCPCSVRGHRDLLPGLRHRPLQLPGALCAAAALRQVQVSLPGWPRRA